MKTSFNFPLKHWWLHQSKLPQIISFVTSNLATTLGNLDLFLGKSKLVLRSAYLTLNNMTLFHIQPFSSTCLIPTFTTYPSEPNMNPAGIWTSLWVPSCTISNKVSTLLGSLSAIKTARAPWVSAVLTLETNEQPLQN